MDKGLFYGVLLWEGEQKIQDVASRLEIQLDKYRTLPRVLVFHLAIRELLANPVKDNVRSVNRMLSTYNQSLSSDAVYLMSRGGVTLAGSNWLTVLFCNF